MNIRYVSSNSRKAKRIVSFLTAKYTNISPLSEHRSSKIDIILVIGGDGQMLHTMHNYMNENIPFYGINAGSIGFLMNDFSANINLVNAINSAEMVMLKPLQMEAIDHKDLKYYALAVNEVSIYRMTNQTAKFEIIINDYEKTLELIGDGALVATPAGSSAYNLAAGGHILPLSSNLLALTPICPFRPRRWTGAILSNDKKITFEIKEHIKRPVNAVADFVQINNVKKVIIAESQTAQIKLLVDKTLEDRIMKEQFWHAHF